MIEKLEKGLNENFENLPFPEQLTSPYNETINETAWRYLENKLNNDQIFELVKNTAKRTDNLSNAFQSVIKRVEKYYYQSTFWGYFSLLGQIIQVVTITCLIFGYFIKNNFFGWFTTTLVSLEPKSANAWQLISDIQILPDIKFFPDFTIEVLEDTAALSYLINMSFVLVFVLLSILSLTCSCFRKILVTNHTGGYSFNAPATAWSLMINMYYEQNKLFYNKVECIHIRIQLVDYINIDDRLVLVKNALDIWSIRLRRDTKGIGLSKPIELYALD